MENTEVGQIAFAETIKVEYLSNVAKIKERSPETLKANFENGMRVLQDEYFVKRTRERRFGSFLFSKDKAVKELNQKAKGFKDYFDQKLFANIIHTSSLEFEDDESGQVTLLSANRVGGARHQGDFDASIGSNDMIFANSRTLRSRSFGGPNHYKISSKDAYVVPMDVAVMHAWNASGEELNDESIAFYASKNIFSATDFETYFSTYCATLFDTPEDAIKFFQVNNFLPLKAGVWHSDDRLVRSLMSSGEKDKQIAIKMRELYIKKNLFPPFSPEWQFRDEVKAVKVEKVPAYADYGAPNIIK